MYTILTIVISAAVGVGSTLLVQTLLLQPAPVVVACPEAPTAAEQELVDKALQPLEGTYQPQGRFLPMPGASGRAW